MPIPHAPAAVIALLLATGCGHAPTAQENAGTNTDRPRDGGLSGANGVPSGRGIGSRYELSPESSSLYVVVRNDPSTFLTGLGRDHVIVAQGWTGTTTWSDLDPSGCRVHVTIPVDGFVVDPDGYREKAALPGTSTDYVKAQAREAIIGSEVLDASQWTTVEFHAAACERGEDGRTDVSGDLSFRGQTHRVTVPMTVTTNGREIRAIGDLEFNTIDWGMTPYSALGGWIKHRGRLELHIDLLGRR